MILPAEAWFEGQLDNLRPMKFDGAGRFKLGRCGGGGGFLSFGFGFEANLAGFHFDGILHAVAAVLFPDLVGFLLHK